MTTVYVNATMQVSLACNKQVVTTDPTTGGGTNLSMDLANVSQGAFRANWNNGVTPDATDAWSGQVTLSGGAATIDMTSLTQSGLSTTVNASGKKLRAISVLADAGNANTIAIGTGASNGYTGIGTISGLLAGNMAVHTCAGSTAIDGTHKTLDLAGTGAQILNVLLIFGT